VTVVAVVVVVVVVRLAVAGRVTAHARRTICAWLRWQSVCV
jgi:hypothetical protein